MRRLAELPVVLLDAQATSSSPATGALLEVGWAPLTGAAPLAAAAVETCVVARPPGTPLPRAVARLTGICPGEWECGEAPESAWHRLLEAAARVSPQPIPLVIHFARFETPFLQALHGRYGGSSFPFDVLCTHAIARRLLPGLPRRSLRALAGYYGAAVPTLRRSADHVVATAFVWRHLLDALEQEGIGDLESLHEWLERPAPPPGRAARVYPFPRERRRELPRGPGVYRLLRAGGAVVYVGKATSLRQRVGSHFHAHGGERALEMLSQVRDVSCTETATALEAALLEADEIKRLAPPYNRALTTAGRALWFASADLCELRQTSDETHPVGPLASPTPFESLAALRAALALDFPVSRAARARALGLEPAYAPGPECFAAGRARFVEEHGRLASARDVLRVGARLWAGRGTEGISDFEPEPAEPDDSAPASSRSRPSWDPARVQTTLEETVLRAAHAVRRAHWLARLSDSSLAWSEPGRPDLIRVLEIEGGAVARRVDLQAGVASAPVPAGADRPLPDRRAAIDLATFDRLRVLTTELRTLTAEAASLELRLSGRVRLSRRRLQAVLRWV